MKNLQLSLKTKWFEMTKSGVKTEDYRDLTPYWAKRFMLYNEKEETKDFWETLCGLYSNGHSFGVFKDNLKPKKFENNIMTLGYPKGNDLERILKLEHKGIEIRTGNPDWGAEEGKLYFVILHGTPTE